MQKNKPFTFKKDYARIWKDIQLMYKNRDAKRAGKVLILLSLRDIAQKWGTSVQTIAHVEKKFEMKK